MLITSQPPAPYHLPPPRRLPVGGGKGRHEQSLKISLSPSGPILLAWTIGLAAQTLPTPHPGRDVVTTDSSTSPQGFSLGEAGMMSQAPETP